MVLLKVEWVIMSAHIFSLITVISFNNKTISSHHSSIINDLREITLIETKGPTRLNGNFAATWAAELQLLLVQRNWQFSKDFLWWRMLLIKVAIDQSSWYSLDFSLNDDLLPIFTNIKLDRPKHSCIFCWGFEQTNLLQPFYVVS